MLKLIDNISVKLKTVIQNWWMLYNSYIWSIKMLLNRTSNSENKLIKILWNLRINGSKWLKI